MRRNSSIRLMLNPQKAGFISKRAFLLILESFRGSPSVDEKCKDNVADASSALETSPVKIIPKWTPSFEVSSPQIPRLKLGLNFHSALYQSNTEFFYCYDQIHGSVLLKNPIEYLNE